MVGRKKERKMVTSLRHMNSDEAIDCAIERAERAAAEAKLAREGSKKPLFLWLKPGHKALVRPLVSRLSSGPRLMKHNLWNRDRDLNVNSVCACEMEPAQTCLYCEMAKDNKKLTAGEWFYLPVYVYHVVDEDGSVITYEEMQEDKSKVSKEVKGFRLIELTPFGRVAPLLKYFRNFPKDPDNCLLNECDFSIEQVGEGSSKVFMPMHKNPKPMHEKIKAQFAAMSEDDIYNQIFTHCPPRVDKGDDPFSSPLQGDRATDSFVQGVKNAQESAALDDTITDF